MAQTELSIGFASIQEPLCGEYSIRRSMFPICFNVRTSILCFQEAVTPTDRIGNIPSLFKFQDTELHCESRVKLVLQLSRRSSSKLGLKSTLTTQQPLLRSNRDYFCTSSVVKLPYKDEYYIIMMLWVSNTYFQVLFQAQFKGTNLGANFVEQEKISYQLSEIYYTKYTPTTKL